MKPSSLAPLVVAALLAPAAAGAHGVALDVERREGGVAARARYDGGRPLAGARYEIVSPAHPERAFDEGRTDPHGWVAFTPDAPGTWRVRIVDASGHGHVAEIEVPPAAPAVPAAAPPAPTAPPLGEPAAGGGAARPSLLRVAAGALALALAFAALSAVLRRRAASGR